LGLKKWKRDIPSRKGRSEGDPPAISTRVGYTSRREVSSLITAPTGTVPAEGPVEGPTIMKGTREEAWGGKSRV
jgi:hypothetical protein